MEEKDQWNNSIPDKWVVSAAHIMAAPHQIKEVETLMFEVIFPANQARRDSLLSAGWTFVVSAANPANLATEEDVMHHKKCLAAQISIALPAQRASDGRITRPANYHIIRTDVIKSDHLHKPIRHTKLTLNQVLMNAALPKNLGGDYLFLQLFPWPLTPPAQSSWCPLNTLASENNSLKQLHSCWQRTFHNPWTTSLHQLTSGRPDAS